MFRYETISSHDGKYKLSALMIDKDGYSDAVFTKDNSSVTEDFDNLMEITGTILCGIERGMPIKIAGIPIEGIYYRELLEMFNTAIELGYFTNVNQEK